MLPSPGDLIGGKYRIARLLGEGGMGAVYEAKHEVLGASVALKFLQPELAQRPELIARFMQEARVAATVTSPHVARVTDVDRLPNGSAYLVMELLVGESLQQRLDRGLVIPIDEAIDITLQILLGLETAHEAGVIHRDLKPDNVFITVARGGQLVKLVDFGIAKLRHNGPPDESLTRPGEVMGTPEYMSPEQALGSDQVDARADLYAVGVILYEMLTLRRPIEADDPGEIIEKVVMGQAVPVGQRDPSLPSALAAVIDDATAPDPARRPPSARELRLRLAPFATVLSHAGQIAAMADPFDAPPSMIPPSMRPARPSSVPDTLPPHDAGPPPSVLATDLRALGVQTGRSGRPPKTRSMSWRRPYLIFALVTGAVFFVVGTWLFFNSSIMSSGEPPPLPTIVVPEATPAPPLEEGYGQPSERKSTRRPSARPPSRTPREPEEDNPSAEPSPPFPPFSLPSAFPPIPLPQIPGMPTFPTATSSAAPPASGSGAGAASAGP